MPDYSVNPPDIFGSFVRGQEAQQKNRLMQLQEQGIALQRGRDAEDRAFELKQRGQAEGEHQNALQAKVMDDLAMAVTWVEQGASPEEQQARLNQAADFYKPVFGERVDQFRNLANLPLLKSRLARPNPTDEPADVREHKYYLSLDAEGRAEYLKRKRAAQLATIGGVPTVRDAAGGLTPLSTLPQEVAAAGAIKGAEATAAAAAANTAKAAANEPKRQERIRQQMATIDTVTGTIDKALGQVGFLTTGLPGAVMRNIPGMPAKDLAATVQTVKSNIGFDRLQQMRDASPTGGALGQVAVQELEGLQSSIAALDTAQSREQVVENLEAVKRHYLNWKRVLEQSRKQPPQASDEPEGDGWGVTEVPP